MPDKKAENHPNHDKSARRSTAYEAIIQEVFLRHYQPGVENFKFDREEIVAAAVHLGFDRPKNVGDVIYTFRYRSQLPAAILATQPKNRYWLILGAGDGKYRFRLSSLCYIAPTIGLLTRKLPDATPQIITRYALGDEQALLARVRYNRLIDIFLGITAYSLQSHLRTRVDDYGQIEIDELYAGLDSRGIQYIVPVQAKGGNDKLGVIQTIQDTTFCQKQERYKDCVLRTVSAQFMEDGVIAMFELFFDGDDVSIVDEKHYQLVVASSINGGDLTAYR